MSIKPWIIAIAVLVVAFGNYGIGYWQGLNAWKEKEFGARIQRLTQEVTRLEEFVELAKAVQRLAAEAEKSRSTNANRTE